MDNPITNYSKGKVNNKYNSKVKRKNIVYSKMNGDDRYVQILLGYGIFFLKQMCYTGYRNSTIY